MSFHLEGDWVNAKAASLEGEEGSQWDGIMEDPRGIHLKGGPSELKERNTKVVP